MTWNPQQYLAFEDQRLRPALDLLARIPLESPESIVDLGCGTGNVTALLKQRWPNADITGVDNSPEMLAKARNIEGIRWAEADVASWSPLESVDLIFSNATLHWIADHSRLFPRLMEVLKPKGILAVQMPRNFDAPSHTLIRDIAASGPWQGSLQPVLGKAGVLSPADYYEILSPCEGSLELWETEYLHILEGENPVADWTRGTTLVPVLDALEEPQKAAFEAEYRARIRAAYPPRQDGKTLFPFKRLFLVASKPG
jgi:trans-aconitate 2-methyltransferase